MAYRQLVFLWYRQIFRIRYGRKYFCLYCIQINLYIYNKENILSLYYVCTKFPYEIWTKILSSLSDIDKLFLPNLEKLYLSIFHREILSIFHRDILSIYDEEKLPQCIVHTFNILLTLIRNITDIYLCVIQDSSQVFSLIK